MKKTNLFILSIIIFCLNLSCGKNSVAPNFAPIVVIKTPVMYSGFLGRTTISFTAEAFDPEKGRLSDSSMVWTSDIDGEIGIGEVFQTSNLSHTVHTIVLTATDSRGNIGSDTVIVQIFSNTDPVVTITNPADSTIFILNDTITFFGVAIDFEDSVFHDSVYFWYSDLDGEIGIGSTLKSYNLTEGIHLITLTVFDSENNIAIDTTYVQVISPPVVSIVSPVDSINVYPGVNFTFLCTAFDLEDGILDGASLVWSSDIDGEIGTGLSFQISTLTEGFHVITLTAMDSDGNMVINSITMKVTSSWNIQLDGSYLPAILDYDEDTVSIGRISSNYFTKLTLSKQSETLAQKSLGDVLAFSVYHMLNTSDDAYAFTGYRTIGNDTYVTVAKTDESGAVFWPYIFDNLNILYLFSSCAGNNGGVLVVGTNSHIKDDYDSTYIFCTKIDANGNLEWNKSIDSTRSGGGGCIATADNGYIISGSVYSFISHKYELYLSKIDSIGNTIWEKTFNRSNYSYGSTIIEDPNGGYAVLVRDDTNSGFEYNLMKVDELGDFEWEKGYSGFGSEPLTINTTPSGGYILAGRSRIFENKNMKPYIIITDANGDILRDNSLAVWSSTKYFEVEDVVLNLDGSVVLVGNNMSSQSKILIFKTDENLNVY